MRLTRQRRRRSPEAISSIWTRLVGQGVASLGCDFSEGGLREILVVMAELGRAACPAPMWSAALTNLALSGCGAEAAADLLEKLHDGTARVAFSFGAFDPDRNAGYDPGRGWTRAADCFASSKLRRAARTSSCRSNHQRLRLSSWSAAGVDIEPTRAMGAWGLYEVRLNSAPASLDPAATACAR